MEKEDKVNICVQCAKSIMRRFKGFKNIEFDELVNIGFANLTAEDRDKALTQAYLYMLKSTCWGKERPADVIAREKEYLLIYKERTENKSIDSINEMLDLQAALAKLTPKELMLIHSYFYNDMTFEEIAAAECKKCGGSAHWEMSQLLKKLRNIV